MGPFPGFCKNVDPIVPGGAKSQLDDTEQVDAFRAMLRSRVLDERAFSLQRQGRLGTFSPVRGQEASVIGSALALEPGRDWLVPQYRELPAMLHMGYSMTRFLLYFMGNPVGNEMSEGVNVMPFQISLAAQLPHAVGLAWGLRLQGSDAVVLTYFGDGASSEGDAHEALNLAGVRRAPVVFLLQNNGYAISTPVSLQTAAETFAARAAGYGFHGEVVDGNDLFAVYEVSYRAVERARAGDGPTLIESRTYRLGPHNTADDPTRYVDPAELDAQRALDPIERLRAHLRDRGLLDDAAEQRLLAEVTDEVAAAVNEAEGFAPAHPGQIFEHVFAEPTPRLRDQRDAAVRGAG
jgi:pyruvate dehydrogenase E1 component alpha subunit